MKRQSAWHSEILLRNQETKQRTKINFVESMTWNYWFAKHHKALTHNDWLFFSFFFCASDTSIIPCECVETVHITFEKGSLPESNLQGWPCLYLKLAGIACKYMTLNLPFAVVLWSVLGVTYTCWPSHVQVPHNHLKNIFILCISLSAVVLRGQMMASDLLELGLNGVVNWCTCLPETKVIFSWRATIVLYYLAIPLAPIS